MSLLGRGRHTVLVEVAVKGAPGPYKEPTWTYLPAVSVWCSVQPLRAEEANDFGVQVDTAYRVIARGWPGGPRTRVTWNGRTLFQHGETLHYSMSPRTAHDVAVVEASTTEVR